MIDGQISMLTTDTLSAARADLEDNLDEGMHCPCCGQFAKVYRRKINSTMARDLISMWRAGSYEFTYLPTVRLGGRSNREESKLRYWGLVEEEPLVRPDGGRAGWWRVTQKGAHWLYGWSSLPKYALIYDSECRGLEGEPVTIRDALGSRFNYDELMAGL